MIIKNQMYTVSVPYSIRPLLVADESACKLIYIVVRSIEHFKLYVYFVRKVFVNQRGKEYLFLDCVGLIQN